MTDARGTQGQGTVDLDAVWGEGPGAATGDQHVDVVVIGGGQSALAVGYYLRRSGLTFVLLDDQPGPGGAWRHAWPSLHLFSPAPWSSLPGRLMPRGADDYPTRDEVLAYLADYEARYALPVARPVQVLTVEREAPHDLSGDPGEDAARALRVRTTVGTWHARAVVSATGAWANPRLPDVPGWEAFRGRVLHSAAYPGPAPFAGRRVLVVGGGNSGAQLVADLADVARVTWVTREPPRFLPDAVDGRFLFGQATARHQALRAGRTPDPPRNLGDVVAVPPVRAARARGALDAVPMFARFTATGVVWPDGREEAVDAVLFATGFAPALAPLAPLGVVGDDGRVAVRGTRAVAEPRLWLVGYGEWTGFASATLIGVGRSARATVEEIASTLRSATVGA